AVGGEGEGAAVGAPRGVELGEPVVGELPDRLRLEVDDVEVGDAALDAGEGDAAAVRAPRRVREGADAADGEAAHDVAAVDVEDRDLVVAPGEADVGELLPVRAPRPRALDEPDGVEVGVGPDGLQLLDDLAALGVGEEEGDAEEVTLREEGDVAAVRAHLRGDVDVAGVEVAGEDAPGAEAGEGVGV